MRVKQEGIFLLQYQSSKNHHSINRSLNFCRRSKPLHHARSCWRQSRIKSSRSSHHLSRRSKGIKEEVKSRRGSRPACSSCSGHCCSSGLTHGTASCLKHGPLCVGDQQLEARCPHLAFLQYALLGEDAAREVAVGNDGSFVAVLPPVPCSPGHHASNLCIGAFRWIGDQVAEREILSPLGLSCSESGRIAWASSIGAAAGAR
jgi:hypothetical protein